MIGTRAAGLVISPCFVIAIGKDVLKINNPKMKMESGGQLEL